MKRFLKRIKNNKLQYWLLTFLALPLFFGSVSAARDLLDNLMAPTRNYATTIDLWDTEQEVWESVFHNDWVEIDIGEWFGDSVSIIAKFTRLLLSLVVALSITMILVNGMKYIIETGQWKEGKDLVKNIVYIVIGILVSLFSITIITIIQSVETTLYNELEYQWDNRKDDELLKWKKTDFSTYINHKITQITNGG